MQWVHEYIMGEPSTSDQTSINHNDRTCPIHHPHFYAGHEAAAHGGDVTSLVLIPSIRARVDLPIIAAGGFGTGQGLLAALSLGADAVAMGTRFACTQESPLHENVKQAIVHEKMTESDTIYSKHFDGIWARVMRTPTTEQAAKRVGRACKYIPVCTTLTSINSLKYQHHPSQHMHSQ